MEFKKWLEAGEYGTASLISGAGGGSGGFDSYGDQQRVATKDTKKMPPRGNKDKPSLASLGTKQRKLTSIPRDNTDSTLVKDLSMNSGGSGQFA